MYKVHEPRVVVVGGGLTGLTMALFLDWHGIRPVVVERHHDTSPQPKARRIGIRTMELFRQIGIADAVVDAARDLADYQFMAAGPTLATAEALPFRLPGGMPDWSTISPSTACLCAQDKLEPVLREIAVGRGCDVRFGVELVEVAQRPDGIEARVRTGAGDTELLRAQYLVAADGASSPIRNRLGIARSGRGGLGRAVNIYFRADLSELVRGREFNLCQIESPDVPGAFMSVDGAHRWIFSTSVGIDRPVDQWPQVLRGAIGESDVDIELLSVLPWEPGMFVAERYRADRIFLAGDAAHVMPPYAAAGANTGIADAHNLAWKLAMALRDEAGEALLDSYHDERRPIGWFVADQSSIRPRSLRDPFAAPADGTAQADPLALMLGLRYRAGAVIDDGSAHTTTRLDLSGQPGTRLPHRWLPDGRSILDLVGPGWALLTGPHADWTAAAHTTSPLVRLHRLDEKWPSTVGLDDEGALLVRPDQIIAWRCPARPAEPASALAAALRQLGAGSATVGK